MICYQCICEGSTAAHMACAVCSRCGGGACERHVVESGRMHTGLSGAAQTWLICTRCYYGNTSVAAQAEKAVYIRAEEGAAQKFFARLPWKRQRQEPAQEPVLPSANEAVETVEAFLRMIKVEAQDDVLVEETEDTSRKPGESES
ncbi:hypothetical protein KSC_091340 [Ktedonobacter sp. SOSP1-52]|uniref:hypothetical protein n=1 Tax=Ktedonobacter sp. SOSP1-52 TaxID=2778366 RepID=UPI0019167E23|nr:hypothetical protein [Ktedonobacter sp. SOSP1-52]GHO70242.1 hypothetical protein KSC_091340 [Ktedonobacter sp. SOSP1-52]